MDKSKVRLFVDFDGTVTHRDVGHGIFHKFLRPELIAQGWHEEILDEWRAGRISSRECLTLECEYSLVTQEELNAELETYTLTAGFVETARYCREKNIFLMILSDGLDYYIEYILGKYGLSDVMFRSNHMYFENDSLGVEFPYSDKGCGRCGNCKRWHMDMLRRDGDSVIYVGDGYSDRYAVRSSDIIFARRELIEYCKTAGIPYKPYQNFYDILKFLENSDGNI